jgi:ribosomal-protein-alanine N-acetyltransferase
MEVHARVMIRRDFPEVLAVEAASFEFPWRMEDLVECLRQLSVTGVVAEHNDRIVGFMVYDGDHAKLQLLTLAVAPEFRRRGVGAQMVAKLIRKLAGEQTRILTEVRETNLPAQMFLRACDFRAVSVLRDFYDRKGVSEDAYLMQYRLRPGRPAMPVNRIAALLEQRS